MMPRGSEVRASVSDAQELSTIDRLRTLTNGYQVSRAIHVAAALGIADLLGDGPRDAADLAAATGSDAATLYRLLRALASVGVFREDASGAFALSDIGEALRSDVPGSLAGWAAFIGRDHHWQTCGHLLHSVRTGENAFAALPVGANAH